MKSTRTGVRFRGRTLIIGLFGAGMVLATIAPTPSAAQVRGDGHMEQVDHLRPLGVVNLTALANAPATPSNVRHLSIVRPIDETAHPKAVVAAVPAALGGGTAPTSAVVNGGDNLNFNALSAVDQKTAGTGSYANTGLDLEPPDQALCTGNGFVLEGVNLAMRVFDTAGNPKTAPIQMNQFFGTVAGGTSGPTDFMSDPQCLYDHQTNRWFVTVLDLTSQGSYPNFQKDTNYIAVSNSSDPTLGWTIFGFDVTDNGMNGSPMHTGCVSAVGTSSLVGCLGDQPHIGTDRFGIYITDNEYAFAEVFPVPPPVSPPLQQVPVLRSGVSQLYALSKLELVTNTVTTLVRFDTSTVPFPGAPVPSEDAPWQTITPAQPVFGDNTPPTPGGVEYFTSEVGLPVGHNANQIVVWSWTNTQSIQNGPPLLTLQHVIINTASPSDTFFVPDPSPTTSGPGTPFDAYQMDGPHGQTAHAGDPEEHLNANDDRMAWLTLSGGNLWTALNTWLPATNPSGTGHEIENRVGIMYFKVHPSIDSGGSLSASTVLDGYINVPDANVLFPSIGPRVDGATVMTFTLAGINYFPSLAWARLDGLAPGQAPDVHIARAGVQPEDGFTGEGLAGQQGGMDAPPCNPCVARWGDYSASQVDEHGCIWGAAEYIPTVGVAGYSGGNFPLLNFPFGGNWGTGIVEVCPAAVLGSSIAETPFALGLPFLGVATAGVVVAMRRRRSRARATAE